MNRRIDLGHFGILEHILHPKKYFFDLREDFLGVCEVVREAFGSNIDEEDIYHHVVSPEKVYLLRGEENQPVGMFSYTTKNIFGKELLYIEGIAISKKFQGRGVTQAVNSVVHSGENYIGMRTQNPHMYRVLEKFCDKTYPSINGELSELVFDLGKVLGMRLDDKGVARGYYGKSLYGKVNLHPRISHLFDNILKMNYNEGDSVVCVGIKN